MQIFHQKQRRGSICQNTKQHENYTADGMLKSVIKNFLIKVPKLLWKLVWKCKSFLRAWTSSPTDWLDLFSLWKSMTCWLKHPLQTAGSDTFSGGIHTAGCGFATVWGKTPSRMLSSPYLKPDLILPTCLCIPQNLSHHSKTFLPDVLFSWTHTVWCGLKV